MFKHVVILSSALIACQAYGQGGAGRGMSRGYGQEGSSQPIHAAIQSKHNVQYYDVPSSGKVQMTSIEVGANSVPLNLIFRSASSRLNVQQVHQGAEGSRQESQSEDEPHRLIHRVTKPIYQEVREVISPYRKITQEFKPVHEEIQTIVARESSKQTGSGNYGSMSSMGGY